MESFIFIFLKSVALFPLDKTGRNETESVFREEIIQHWMDVWPGSAFLIMSVS